MKKIFSLILLIAGLLWSLILPVNAENTKDYAILVYMNGSNLESDKAQATKAVNEMIKVSGDKKFPGIFIVETGGTKNWHLKELANTENQRFIIEDGKIQHMTKLPNKSMGNSENFKEFLQFGMNREAKHYILVFWNHGEGSLKGFGYDELHNKDTLTLEETKKAFEDLNIAKKFDLIGFDTCLMSTIETAQLLSKYGNYMLASQETEKQGGWNYNNFSILSNKNITVEKLAKSIMDEYIIGENYYSITLWDLKNVNKLTETLENSLYRWKNKMDILALKTLSLRKDMLDFGGNIKQKELNYTYPEMVDLDEVISTFAGTNKGYLTEYSNAKNAAVIYHLSSGYLKNPSGINIFLPYGKDFSKEDLNLYKTSSFSPSYIEFVEKYYNALDSKNKFSLGNAPKIDDNDICTLKTGTNNINNAYISLFKPVGARKYVSLGYMKQDTKINKNNDTIKVSKPTSWVYALEQPLYVIETSKNNYLSPMLLKRNEQEKIVNLEFTEKEGHFSIVKISEVNDKITASRTLEGFKQGDKLTPLYPIFKFNDINKKFTTNLKPISYQKGIEKNIIYKNIIGLKMQDLNDTNYQLRIMLENSQGEQAYSLPCTNM